MAQKKVFKFSFIAHVKIVSLALKFPCVVSVMWKRGEKTAEVRERRQIEAGVATFNQKLQIECNMVYDSASKRFEQKKTKFNILIFSEKGNKQAGEVHIDVAEILNEQKKEMHYQKPLEKCPDKNAKLVFALSGYMKSQIDFDQVSQASTRTYNINGLAGEPKPDFKKKKKQETQPVKQTEEKKDNHQKPETKDSNSNLKSERSVPSKILIKQNVNVNKVQLVKLQEQNRKLKDQLRELKQLQIENQNLKRQYEDSQKKSVSYYKKKYDEIKKQHSETKSRLDAQHSQMTKKENLQKEMCECKQKMGRILNFALMNGNSSLAEEFYNIYQMKNVPTK